MTRNRTAAFHGSIYFEPLQRDRQLQKYKLSMFRESHQWLLKTARSEIHSVHE